MVRLILGNLSYPLDWWIGREELFERQLRNPEFVRSARFIRCFPANFAAWQFFGLPCEYARHSPHLWRNRGQEGFGSATGNRTRV
jgi:hypothetical protein